MDTKINWSDFPIFLAVIEQGSLSGAARKLNISQPTVGRRISALEEQIGSALLHKTSSGLAPTEMGILVLEHSRNMEREANAIRRSTLAKDQELAGEVIISASQGIGDIWLPLAIRPFHQQYPEINLVVDVNFQMANLAKREADIALRWRGPGNQNSLIGRKVVTTGYGLYASTSYLDANGRPKTEADLANHSAVAVKIGENSPVWPTNLDDISTPPRELVFCSNSFLTHETAITSGYGIGSNAHALAERMQGVERVLPEFEVVQDLWIVAHDDLSRNKRIRLVFDYLIEALQKDQTYFRTGEKASWVLD
ncbi:Transcriptional regulator, LysR family [hydrothermal vent metagenome]|uniref:Transcriptional regulator, LysR family n=1 Tax=hydrothermal vent metagenome TaxID=652676 RepID=A0A3B0RZJ6_9ZZZZ